MMEILPTSCSIFSTSVLCSKGGGEGDCSFLDLPSSYFFQYVLSFSNLSPRLLTPSSSYPFYVSYVKSSTFQLDVFNSFLFSSSSFPSPCSSPCSSSFFLRDFLSRCLKEKRSHAPNNGVSMTNAVTNYYPCKPV